MELFGSNKGNWLISVVHLCESYFTSTYSNVYNFRKRQKIFVCSSSKDCVKVEQNILYVDVKL